MLLKHYICDDCGEPFDTSVVFDEETEDVLCQNCMEEEFDDEDTEDDEAEVYIDDELDDEDFDDDDDAEDGDESEESE